MQAPDIFNFLKVRGGSWFNPLGSGPAGPAAAPPAPSFRFAPAPPPTGGRFPPRELPHRAKPGRSRDTETPGSSAPGSEGGGRPARP